MLRGDIFGGFTAAVVVFPAALAFGIASGLGASAGIYGSIAVGFFAAVFGGTRTQISGATGPMAVAMAVIVTSHAQSLTEALTIVVLGGCFQALLGASKIGRFVAYTPQVVISGFMSGIGVIVILIQFLPFLGSASVGGPMDSIRALPEAVVNANFSAVAIAAVTLVIALFWPVRWSVYFPGPVAALICGTLLGVFWLHDAPVIGPIAVDNPTFLLELPTAKFLIHAVQPALILALLGSVDSLLTSIIADQVTGTKHNPHRELIGQGIGNAVAGMIGGMPGAGNTLGTLTNIRAGGTSRVSGATYAILLFVLVFGLGEYLEPIPHAVLAGVLIKIGIDIVDWRLLVRLHRLGPQHLIVLLTTLGITVFIDLVTAVTVGLIIAGMAHARQLEGLELDSVVSTPLLDHTFFGDVAGSDKFIARTGLIAMRGMFTVASSHRLIGAFSVDVQKHELVIFDFSETTHVDDSAAMVIDQLIGSAYVAKTEVIVVGLTGSVLDTIEALDLFQDVASDRYVETIDDAREVAKVILNVGAH